MRRMGSTFYALGRKKAGEMNKTEQAYSKYLLCKKLAGKIVDYSFESLTLKLANACRYTPDFVVLTNEGRIQLHEVKGSRRVFADDAKVKVKMAAQKFPYFEVFVVYPKPMKDGGGWEYEAYIPCEE